MKKILFLCAFAALISLSSCSLIKQELPVLGIITFGDTAYVNTAELENNALYSTYSITSAPKSEAEAIGRVAEKKPFAIVVCAAPDMKIMIESCAENNIPVIFIAGKADTKALSSYDKAWHLSANESQGGELLGEKIGNAFKSGEVIDQNSDDILQCLEISQNSFGAVDSAVQSAEDLGVYSSGDKLTAKSREEAAELFIELYTDKMPPEIILCENELLALGANDALKQMSKTAPIAYIHNNITQLKLKAPELFSAAAYPSDEITVAAKKFIENILANEAVNNNTEYRLDKNKTVYFVYSLA